MWAYESIFRVFRAKNVSVYPEGDSLRAILSVGIDFAAQITSCLTRFEFLVKITKHPSLPPLVFKMVHFSKLRYKMQNGLKKPLVLSVLTYVSVFRVNRAKNDEKMTKMCSFALKMTLYSHFEWGNRFFSPN